LNGCLGYCERQAVVSSQLPVVRQESRVSQTHLINYGVGRDF
jgi:hypothetical protein